MAEKKGRFRELYITGAMIFFASVEMDVGVGIALGIFTIIFTGLAHLIFKIVTLQEGFNAGAQGHPQTRRPLLSSQRPRGNPSYDQLIRKMQVSDLSGMSVAQAASTYASFFKYPAVSAEPFFSNPYVKEVLGIGSAQVSAQAIAASPSSTSQTKPTLDAQAFWSSMPASSTEATEVCANPTCSTPITVFDFRCYKCRNRFCAACKGDKITCPSCS